MAGRRARAAPGQRLGRRPPSSASGPPRRRRARPRPTRSPPASRPAGGGRPGTGDGLAELDPFEGVAAGQVEHGPRRADQLVPEGELGQGDGGRPRRRHDLGSQRLRVHVAVHLDQPELGVHAAHRPQGQVGRRHDEGDLRVRRLRRPRRPTSQATRRAVPRPRTREMRLTQLAGRGPVPERRQHVPRRRGHVEPERQGEHLVERGGGGVRRARQLEEEGDGLLRVDRQGIAPAELAEGRRRGARRSAPRAAWRRLRSNTLAVLAVHQRSLPRSSSRRAMMLR